MTVNEGLRLIAGTFLLVSLLLAHFVNPNWLWFAAFIGVNLLQSAFTRWCPMMVVLRKAGFREGGGYLLNISSVAGKEGFGDAAAYSASKFALVGFSESLREEGIPHNIKVSVLCPGYVDTPMVAGAGVPPEEMIHPDDIAATCLYLLNLSSPAAVPEIVMRRMSL